VLVAVAVEMMEVVRLLPLPLQQIIVSVMLSILVAIVALLVIRMFKYRVPAKLPVEYVLAFIGIVLLIMPVTRLVL